MLEKEDFVGMIDKLKIMIAQS